MPDIISRKDAVAHRLIRYFTGKRCTHGHIAERWTSNGNCLECGNATRQTPERKEYMRSYERQRVLEVDQGSAGRLTPTSKGGSPLKQ